MGLSVDRAVRFQGQHHIAVVNRQAVRNLNSAHDAVDRVIPFLWIQIQRMKIICFRDAPSVVDQVVARPLFLNRIEKQRRSNCAFYAAAWYISPLFRIAHEAVDILERVFRIHRVRSIHFVKNRRLDLRGVQPAFFV